MYFKVDYLSLVMVILAIFMTLCASVYGGRRAFNRLVSPCLFCVSACLASLATDWLAFTVFMELSSFALVFMVGEKDRDTARFYLYTQLAGGGVLMVALAMGASGVFSLPVGPVPEAIFPLFVLGLGVKAALPGLHFWLPRTHSQAPAEASALLSGYAVKMGIYGLFRVVHSFSPTLMALGGFMAIFGAVMAPLQRDCKRLLAYSTISQLGFMVAAISTGTELGRAAALAHVISHGLGKGLLFFSAGGIEKIWGTRDLSLTGRTVKGHSWMFLLFLLGALSMVGAPFTAGGWSKGLVKLSLEGYGPVVVALTLSGIGTALALCKMAYYGFLRPFLISNRNLGGDLPRCCGCAMSLMCVALFMVGLRPPFGSVESSLKSILPALLGVLIFALMPIPFRPYARPWDMEDILPYLKERALSLAVKLRKGHSGNLVVYLFVLVTMATVLIGFFKSLLWLN